MNPPYVNVSYDCSSQTATLHVEWSGDSVDCVIARMFIDINKICEECLWKLDLMEINTARKTLQSKSEMLDVEEPKVEMLDVEELEVENSDSEESELEVFDKILGKKMII
jgi:hypothetical protein